MMHFSLACLSDTGRIRIHNEDNFYFFGEYLPPEHQSSELLYRDISANEPFAVAVFDGMGGESAGEAASYAAVKSFSTAMPKTIVDEDSVRLLVLNMHEAVCEERAMRRVRTMGSTVAILVVDGDAGLIANVGDSQVFSFKDGNLVCLSQSHTDEEILQALGITDRKPGLTRFLGMDRDGISVEPYISHIALEPGVSILMASDGLTDVVKPNEVKSILSSGIGVRAKVEASRDAALEEGGPDNITVMLCEVVDCDGSKGVIR